MTYENKIKELNPENKQRSRLSPGVRALVDDLLQENKGIRNDIYAKLRNNELTSKDIADLGRADIKMRKIQREVTAAANDPSITLSEKKQIKDEKINNCNRSPQNWNYKINWKQKQSGCSTYILE